MHLPPGAQPKGDGCGEGGCATGKTSQPFTFEAQHTLVVKAGGVEPTNV